MADRLQEEPRAGRRADSDVRARIDSVPKVVRVMDGRLPFGVAPNATTRAAMAELESGGGKRFVSTVALLADLNVDD